MTETDPVWRSFYLFFDGYIFTPEADAVLLHDVSPWIERHRHLLKRWFFIRYNLGGAHIRLRFIAQDGQADALVSSLEDLATASPRVTELTEVPYQPELVRYSGASGLEASETLFQSSSEVCLDLLSKIAPGERPALLGKSLLAQLVLFHAFSPDAGDAAGVSRDFGGAYLRSRTANPEQQQQWVRDFEAAFDRQADRLAQYVTVAWKQLQAGDTLTPELDRFRDAMAPTLETLRADGEAGRLVTDQGPSPWPVAGPYLLHSHLHMLNNRMGVNLKEECYLAVLVQRALDDFADDSEHEPETGP